MDNNSIFKTKGITKIYCFIIIFILTLLTIYNLYIITISNIKSVIGLYISFIIVNLSLIFIFIYKCSKEGFYEYIRIIGIFYIITAILINNYISKTGNIKKLNSVQGRVDETHTHLTSSINQVERTTTPGKEENVTIFHRFYNLFK